MKKLISKIFIIIFIITICLAQPLSNFFGNISHENRVLAEKPELTIDQYTTFIEQFNAYANDNIPLRNALIRLNNYIDYFIYAQSSNTNVIIGSNDWLFYSNANDGDPLACYNGTNKFTDDELKAIAKNCQIQHDYLNSLGKEFVIFIAPNKERVYAEQMPRVFGEPAEVYRALQLITYLRENTNIKIIYPYEELLQAKQEINENIYFKTDTHWNEIGAYIGSATLLKELGINIPSLNELEIDRADYVYGDLANMLSLQDELLQKDYHYAINGYDTHNETCVLYDFSTVIHCFAENVDPRRVYILRDSFSTSMIPYISAQFKETWYRNYDSYTIDDFQNYNPDLVICEVVERYLHVLQNINFIN